MKRVILEADSWGISANAASALSVDQISGARSKIRHYLLQPDVAEELTIPVKPAYRQRFADFIGFDGVEWREVRPYSEFKLRFGQPAPCWMSESQLVELGLFQLEPQPLPELNDEASAAKALLSLLVPQLSDDSLSWSEWITALALTEPQRLLIWQLPPLRQCLIKQLQRWLDEAAATTLLQHLVRAKSVIAQLNYLSQQSYLEKLRSFLLHHGMSYPLPGSREDLTLLQQLPALPLSQAEAGDLVKPWLAVMQQTLNQIEQQQLAAEVLAELVCFDWPELLKLLRSLLEPLTIARFATRALAAALQQLQSAETMALAEEIELSLADYPPLPPQADTRIATDWAAGYLSYAAKRLAYDIEPDAAVGESFARWVLNQQPRISRSQLHWQRLSERIKHHLQNRDNRVIVLMVDALSALQSEQVEQQFKRHIQREELTLQQQLLIAPYPTLTEVGKNALLSGEEADRLESEMEQWLWRIYGATLDSCDEIVVIKNWQAAQQITFPLACRLVICLENRIDERLHDAVRYSHFLSELEPVLANLLHDVNRWCEISDRAGKQPVILLSADHGHTAISQLEPLSGKVKEQMGALRERTATLTKPLLLLEEGFKQLQLGKKHYLLPLKRVRFAGKGPLVHGGLSPEELLIPLFELSAEWVAPQPLPPLQLQPKRYRARSVAEQQWLVQLVIQLHETVERVKIRAHPPFSGQVQAGPYRFNQIDEALNLDLLVVANQAQRGVISLPLTLETERPNHEVMVLEESVEVEFFASMVERDESNQLFEGMF
ncbi:PglZ domain-containing protein [Ectothiorhodospiraceae bacterium BW-2]|nr:PglZ domain-containing protein [Ectothiorhodospiraceae bacterium BW-2]